MRFKIAILLASALGFGAAAQSATAADIPYKAPRPAAVVAYNWTGCYIGGNVGGGWARKDWRLNIIDIDLGNDRGSGVVAGGQIGCDYQVGSWVWGVEGRFNWADIEGNHNDPFIGLVNFSTRVDWFATATGRVGHAWDRTLLYVKGGAAWVRDLHSISIVGIGLEVASADTTRSGWTVGAGIEHAFAWAPGWSGKVEYNYIDLGTRSPEFCLTVVIAGVCASIFDIRQDIHVVSVGLNYRFGGPR
jgi:outer membrane immunogenic protein